MGPPFREKIGSKEDQRQSMMNELLAKKEQIDKLVSEFLPFTTLNKYATNQTEKIDLADISDSIRISLGSLDHAWDLTFALDQRLKEEKLRESK